MGKLFKSIGNYFRGKRDDAAEAIADPIRDGKFAIEDATTEANNFERQIATLMAQRKGFERDRDTAKVDAKKWGSIAVKAAEAGNESDAKEALETQINAERKQNGLADEVKKCKTTEKNLRAQLDQVRSKIAKAGSSHALHAARLEGAKVRKAMQNKAGSLGSALSELDDLERKADKAEDEASAMEELGADANEDLADKYDASNADVDDRLAALMAKSPAKT